MNYTFRIKEVAINKDGTNIWFYPEICTYKTVTTGMLWWKETKRIEIWKNIFKPKGGDYHHFTEKEAEEKYYYWDLKNIIIAFRTIEEAKEWVKTYDEKLTKEREEYKEAEYRYIASIVDTKKYHTISE